METEKSYIINISNNNNINYSYEEMEILLNKIHKIKKEQHLRDILDIIIDNNPNTKINKTATNQMLYFHNLNN